MFRRVWLVSDAPPRDRRALDNEAGDQRLWDPSDEEVWSVCAPTDLPETLPDRYLTISPREGTRCRLCPEGNQWSSFHVAGVNHGYIGDAPTQLEKSLCITFRCDKPIG